MNIFTTRNAPPAGERVFLKVWNVNARLPVSVTRGNKGFLLHGVTNACYHRDSTGNPKCIQGVTPPRTRTLNPLGNLNARSLPAFKFLPRPDHSNPKPEAHAALPAGRQVCADARFTLAHPRQAASGQHPHDLRPTSALYHRSASLH